MTIKHSARGEYWYANPNNKTHCKNCPARIDRGGWREKTIDEIHQSDHQALVPGNGHDGTCESENQVNPENDVQGQLGSSDQHNSPHQPTSSSPHTKHSGTNMMMRSVNVPRRDQSTRHQRPKRRHGSRSTAKATSMKRSKKHINQREGGRSAPIEIADSPEPHPKPEPAIEEDGLDEFVAKDYAHPDETGEYQAQSPETQSESSEDDLLDDFPAGDDLSDDRPIAQNLRQTLGEPPNYKYCYQESIRKNHVYSNGKLVPWDEGDTDNEVEDFEQGEGEEVLDEEGEEFVDADDMWGGEVYDNPLTAKPEDMDDTNIKAESARQNKERLRRTPTQREQRTVPDVRPKNRAHSRRTIVDHHTTNAAGSGFEGDPQFLVEGGLSFLEGSPAGDPNQHPSSARHSRAGEATSSANTTRKRRRGLNSDNVSTMLLTAERPTIRDRNKVTATAARLREQVLPFPRLQLGHTIPKHPNTDSGLFTPPTSTASAPTSRLNTIAPLSPRYHEIPDIDDETTATATILRLRQQLADLTAQLAVERAENTDLQSAYDGMARRCTRLIREVGDLKASGENDSGVLRFVLS